MWVYVGVVTHVVGCQVCVVVLGVHISDVGNIRDVGGVVGVGMGLGMEMGMRVRLWVGVGQRM